MNLPSIDELLKHGATTASVGRIIRMARALDLGAVRAELAFSEEAREKVRGRSAALDRLSAARMRETKLLLFFAEQLREHALAPEEVERLTSEAKAAFPLPIP